MEKPGLLQPGSPCPPTTAKGSPEWSCASGASSQTGFLSSLRGHFESEMTMEIPRKSSRSLTFDDAVDIWLRHWAGEYQHTTAAAYGVNQGRINEVLKGRLHVGSEAVASAKRRAA